MVRAMSRRQDLTRQNSKNLLISTSSINFNTMQGKRDLSLGAHKKQQEASESGSETPFLNRLQDRTRSELESQFAWMKIKASTRL